MAASLTVPLRPAARGWPGAVITRSRWATTWVPVAAVMPRSSKRACSHVTTGTPVDRNFLLTLVAIDDELITTTCIPVAAALVEAPSSTTLTV